MNDAEIIRLRAQGRAGSHIAARMGETENAIRLALVRLGLNQRLNSGRLPGTSCLGQTTGKCPKGHIFASTGRYKSGQCAECQRQAARKRYHANPQAKVERRERMRLDRQALREAFLKEKS